jgi:hypothetical protein
MKTTVYLVLWGSLSFMLNAQTGEELLAKYAKTQDAIYNSYIQKLHCTVTWKAYEPERGFTGKTYITERSVEKRSDGKRHFTLTKSWGERPNTPVTTVEHANHNYSLWDMNKYYHYTYHPDNTGLTENGVLMIIPDDNSNNTYTGICNLADGGEIGGFFYGDDIRIDEELRRAAKVSVLSEMQKINDTDCYVMMAEENGCKYELFLSPEHDYNILKATVERDWWSASRPENYSPPPTKGKSRISISDVKLKKINDSWVVEEAIIDHQYSNELGDHGETKKIIKVEDLIMNPDHKELDSFGLDFIRDGALVYVSGTRTIGYTWQNGKLIPAETNEHQP